MERRKNIFGWLMYDWANSAYVLTVATAVLPSYFAAVVVPPEGAVIAGMTFSAPALWGFMVSLAAFLVFVCAPSLGAIADRCGYLKRFLVAFCILGCFSALMLSFATAGDIAWVVVFFTLAQFGFAGGNIFYDAFLPRIAPREELDSLSGKGFAYGYIGGGLQFLLCLLLITGHEALGIGQDDAARLSMAGAALWWFGFALVTFRDLSNPGTLQKLSGRERPAIGQTALYGIRHSLRTILNLFSNPAVGLFLLAYLFFNDGVMTVISMSTIYGKEELGLPVSALMLTLLLIQFVAFAGSLAFSRLARHIGAKRALILSLVIWSGIVLYAFFITTIWQFMLLGVMVGLVLGGSQALSRSLYAAMIPREESAQYFSFFSIMTKMSSIGGPLVFALVRQFTGSSRLSVLAILFFFLVGILLLLFVRTPAPDRATPA
jgi:MFS transporter, UMF1 family